MLFNAGSNALLPSEPRLHNPTKAYALTEQYLLPSLAELEAFFLAVRMQLDPVLRATIPIKNGKPYPLGQCLEITLAVLKYLDTLDPANLPIAAQSGFYALTRFFAANGSIRRIWGDLRGEYFQNALLIGTLYVDVSNDTVIVTKPKVEILPFHESGLRSITDYAHFARIAEKYWKVCAWPNHVLPELAPSFPMVTVSKEGIIKFMDQGDYLMALNWRQAFRPGESYLAGALMPKAVFESIASRFKDGPHRVASNPSQGRRMALQYARTYRKKRWHQQPLMQQRILAWGIAANRRLSQTTHVIANPAGHSLIKTEEPIVPTIKIDNIEYNTDNLSPDALQQIKMLQMTDAEIARLSTQLAIAQTARIAYANALRSSIFANVTE